MVVCIFRCSHADGHARTHARTHAHTHTHTHTQTNTLHVKLKKATSWRIQFANSNIHRRAVGTEAVRVGRPIPEPNSRNAEEGITCASVSVFYGRRQRHQLVHGPVSRECPV